MNKVGGFADLFIFMIFALIIIVVSGIFIYLGGKVHTELGRTIGDMQFGDRNGTQIVDDTIGKIDQTYQALYWISFFEIVGMVIAILIGSYLVTTKPIFFVPYIFVMIVAIIVAVVISNSYEQIIKNPELASTFEGFVGANYIMGMLPIWITAIGFAGAIIMFSRLGSKQNEVTYLG